MDLEEENEGIEISEDEKKINKLRNQILQNIGDDRKKIQEHIDELQGYMGGKQPPKTTIVENLTAALRAKSDANVQMIKILDLDIKSFIKKSESGSNEDLLNDIIGGKKELYQ